MCNMLKASRSYHSGQYTTAMPSKQEIGISVPHDLRDAAACHQRWRRAAALNALQALHGLKVMPYHTGPAKVHKVNWLERTNRCRHVLGAAAVLQATPQVLLHARVEQYPRTNDTKTELTVWPFSHVGSISTMLLLSCTCAVSLETPKEKRVTVPQYSIWPRVLLAKGFAANIWMRREQACTTPLACGDNHDRFAQNACLCHPSQSRSSAIHQQGFPC